MYRDDDSEPPLLVCQVGTTKLTYQARAIEDPAQWLQERDDWIPLCSADEGKDPAPGTVEGFGRSASNPVGGWYGRCKGYRGRFGMYLPPLLEELRLAEVIHEARNNQMRAKGGPMSTIKVVRYRTKPGHENAKLVEEVFAELAADDPGGLRYVTFRVQDGVSFVHIVTTEGDTNPLLSSPAFKRFQSEIGQRCEEGPVAMDAVIVGEYPLPIG
jgi:hypothetical protein